MNAAAAINVFLAIDVLVGALCAGAGILWMVWREGTGESRVAPILLALVGIALLLVAVRAG